MSERYTSSDLIDKINKYINSSEIDGPSPKLYKFIDDEYNEEKDKVVNQLGKLMEEVYFHNLTTVHNIGKLWEILHQPTIIKRGRKSKKSSPICDEKLMTLKSSVEGIVTGLEDLPNPEFSIGGYIIPNDITFKGVKLGRKPNSLKNYSFAHSYKEAHISAINDAIYTEFAGPINITPESTSTSSNPTNPTNSTLNILNNDQYDKNCYYVNLYDKKPVLPAPIINNVNTIPSTKLKSLISSIISTNDTVDSPTNKSASIHIPSATEIEVSKLNIGPCILPPTKLSKTTIREMSKPKPIVERMDVFYARLRASNPFRYHDNNNTLDVGSSGLVNNSIKLDSGTFASSIAKPSDLSDSTISPCDTPSTCLSPPPSLLKPVVRLGPGRPIGSKNKTPEEREQEMLNKKRRGRPLGSPNKKTTTRKTNEEVIIHDNEIALRINPNKFEVHMLQYTLNNPQVSYAEWLDHSEKIMGRAKEENNETLKSRMVEWEKNTMKEINRIKGKLSLGRSKGKGKEKIVYEPKNEEDIEALEYKYELLETKKDDPFFINLLKRSFEVGSSRKSRFANIADINDLYSMNENNLLDLDNNDNMVEPICNINIKEKFVDDLIDLSDSVVVNNNIGDHYMSGILENNVMDQNVLNVDMDAAMKAYLIICQYVYSVYNTMK